MKNQLIQKTIFILGLTLFYQNMFGQQSPLFSQYPNHYELDNPAAIGNYEATENFEGFSLGLLSRLQWLGSGFEKAPLTGSFYGSFLTKKSVVGMQFFQDRTGIINTTNIGFRYARKLGKHFLLGSKFEYSRFWFKGQNDLFRADEEDDTFFQLAQENAAKSSVSVGGLFFTENISSGLKYFIGGAINIKVGTPFETEKLYFRAGFEIRDIGFTIRYQNFGNAPAIYDGFLQYFLFNHSNNYLGIFYSTDFDSLKIGGIYWAFDIPAVIGNIRNYSLFIGYSRQFSNYFNSNSFDLGLRIRI